MAAQSHWDENYWDEEAAAIVERVGARPTQDSLRGAIAAVLAESFAGFRPARGRGGFKAEFDDLLDRMADQILTDELRY